MTKKTKGRVLKTSAVVLDVAAPLGATIAQFPIWIEDSARATVSGLFLVFAFLCCIPFYKVIFSWLKSPSIPILWTVIFVLLYALAQIINQMLVVAVVGIISNMIGSFIYKYGEKIGEEDDG